MALAPGSRLGPYEVTALIGSGGMGEVYRARDTKLHRDVALKVLPDVFADDPERLARFQREAQVLASLNHPNIAQIHGLEECAGVRALVLEYVDGPTLAHRIAQGPIPINEALPIAKQIAEALEAAHEAGVIHRDLKPANVKVKADGMVKVLDFGLAKALQGDAGSDPLESPTMTAAATRAGVIMGTAAYMSPEQARGKPVDRRADIWSFGVVLLEMLTGTKAFPGDDVSQTLARVIDREPDWSRFPERAPARIRQAITVCLQKDPKQRVRDITAVKLAMEGAFETPAAPLPEGAVAPPPPQPMWQRALPWLVAPALALVVGLAVWSATRLGPSSLVRMQVELPLFSGMSGTPVALSPDDNSVVFVGSRNGIDLLFRRSLNQFGVSPIAGSEGARAPFFSPDGQWIGFLANGALKKVSLAGGPAVTLCGCAAGSGSWGQDDRIVLGDFELGLAQVSADGGTPEVLTIPDRTRGEQLHRWPYVLPGGEAVLFTVISGSLANASVAVLSLQTRQWTTVIEEGQQARYVPTGHVVYAREGTLYAIPFDLARLEVAGTPVPVVEGVLATPPYNFARFSISDEGSLVYVPAYENVVRELQLVWVNREGDEELLPISPGPYAFPRVSPDGRRIAVTVGYSVGDRDIWILDAAGAPPIPLTSQAENAHPIWTPDGERVVFDSTRSGTQTLVWMPADGSVFDAEPLVAPEVIEGERAPRPFFWLPDGQELVFGTLQVRPGPELGGIWALSPADGQPRALVRTEFYEAFASISPNGRWLAYVSNRSGEREVWLQAYDGTGAPRRVSNGGGLWPTWAPDGREVYYLDGDRMMAVEFSETSSAFSLAPTEVVFDEPYFHPVTAPRNHDVAPDGRFLMLKGGGGRALVTQLNVVLNWFEELKARVPVP